MPITPASIDTQVAVQMRGMCKQFGAVAANADVNLTVRVGTVHGLVGENGAGKSTLMSVLYGFYQADAGSIDVLGTRAVIRNADDAIALGIGMVHQHFMLVESLSALDNVMLGAEPHWSLKRSQDQVRSALQSLMQRTGLKVPLDTRVDELAVGDRQRLEILKALYRGAKILILDEPTAVLTPQETRQLFSVLATLRSQGTTLILITHKLKEVMELCDCVTVMRAGKVVLDLPIAQASTDVLAEAMVGRKVNLARVQDPGLGLVPGGATLLTARNLGLSDALQVARLSGVSLTLRAGEIVGVAGVSGNGQTELLEVLSGLSQPQEGSLTVGDAKADASDFTPGHWLEPRTARALGIAHVPEDRHARGLVMDFVAWESAFLGYEGDSSVSRYGWMKHRAMRQITAQWMKRFDVRPPEPSLGSGKFSGGNQQKLILARELGNGPTILLVGQPTRGVDIGAIEFIYGQLRAMRDAGCAVLLVSSELDEILALSDRVVVMVQGRISGELPVRECNEAVLGRLMAGAGQ